MNQKYKVCHIITQLELGGAQENTLYTVANLDKEKFQPLLITGRGGYLDDKAKQIPGLKIYFSRFLVRPVSPIKDIFALLRIYFILKKEKPTIVHTHSSKAGILGRWAAYWANIPVIIHTFHGFGFNPYQKKIIQKIFIWLEKKTAKISQSLIAVSEENMKYGVANNIGKAEQYKVIHSGIEMDKFSVPLEKQSVVGEELGLSEDNLVVGMVACFKIQKSPLDFVRMAELVKKEINLAKFVLIGDGELRGQIEKTIKNRNLAGDVFLLGWRQDIPELISIFDVFVLTSLWEGLPRVLLEALASGEPVVATDVNGNREVIKHGENGFLVKPGDYSTMAKYVIQLLRDKNLREEMGKKGRSIVNQSFEIKQMLKDIEELYKNLI